jgi:hypothetical protein
VSVIVIVRFPVSDVASAIEGLHANAEFFEEISAQGKGGGALHHRFTAGDGELVVVDEWETAEQFQGFFAGNPKIAEVMGSLGVTGDPDISVFGSIDAPGTF